MSKQEAREIARDYQMKGWRVDVQKRRDGRIVVVAVKRIRPRRETLREAEA